MLALMVDALNWLVWAKTEDGSKNQNPPERLPRPGEAERRAREVEATIAAAKAAGLLGG